ncbi:MAG: SPOR domain-containing protein [Prevotella sp.]|nr:SPOR domain-containing protein [Prevotella sp.]
MINFAVMNELSRHIEILLLSNDCVIVPGFGGFVAHHKVAEYDMEEKTFYPPQRVLGFNSQLVLNDSLLVQSYAEAYDLSYPEALRKIENEVEEIKQQIEIEGEYKFRGIGTVSKTAEGYYDFEPCVAGLVSPSLYGFTSYIMDAVNGVADADGVSDTEDSAEKKLLSAADVVTDETEVDVKDDAEDTEDVEDDEVEDEEEERGIYVSYKKMWYAAAASLILLLLPLAYNSLTVGRGSQSSNVIRGSVGDTGKEVVSKIGEGIDTFMKATNSESVPADTVNITEKTVKQEAAGEAVADTKVQAEKTGEVSKETVKGQYSIILASRVSKKGAEDFVKRLNRAGYKEASVYENGSMRRVVYGSYGSEREAERALNVLKKKNETFASTWVQKL